MTDLSDKKSEIFGIDAKYVIIGIIGVCIIGGMLIWIHESNEKWEDLVEDSLKDRGYHVDRIASLNATRLDDTAYVTGTFYSGGVLYNYIINYVKDGGSWRTTSCSVY